MGKLVINSYDEFAAHLGQELGVSDWLQIDQDRINLFADATLDHQWIHVDVERAKTESQYHSTIAHGYLTLSVLPYLWDQIIEVNNIKMLVNYGMDKMRFGQPVVTGSRVRMTTKLHNIQNLRGICKVEIFNLKHLFLEACPVTGLARQIDVGHKLHLDFLDTLALAFLAAAARHVEREEGWLHATQLGQFLFREQLPDFVVGLHVSSWVGAR